MKINKTLYHSIINNFDKISRIAKEPMKQTGKIPVWELKFKKDNISGFVHQDGKIIRNNTEIQILGYRIKKIKKPFFSTWNRTLKNINQMLQDIKENYNTKFVRKKIIYTSILPKEKIEKFKNIFLN